MTKLEDINLQICIVTWILIYKIKTKKIYLYFFENINTYLNYIN